MIRVPADVFVAIDKLPKEEKILVLKYLDEVLGYIQQIESDYDSLFSGIAWNNDPGI